MFYTDRYYTKRLREPLNWSAVWFVAKNDATLRNKVLTLTVHEFIEAIDYLLEKVGYGE